MTRLSRFDGAIESFQVVEKEIAMSNQTLENRMYDLTTHINRTSDNLDRRVKIVEQDTKRINAVINKPEDLLRPVLNQIEVLQTK